MKMGTLLLIIFVTGCAQTLADLRQREATDLGSFPGNYNVLAACTMEGLEGLIAPSAIMASPEDRLLWLSYRFLDRTDLRRATVIGRGVGSPYYPPPVGLELSFRQIGWSVAVQARGSDVEFLRKIVEDCTRATAQGTK